VSPVLFLTYEDNSGEMLVGTWLSIGVILQLVPSGCLIVV